MKKSVLIAVGAIVAVAAFLAGEAVGPKSAEAPSPSATAGQGGAAVIPMSIVSLRETASTSPTVTVEYPQFPSLPKSFSDDIASATLSRLADFRQESAATDAARRATGGGAELSPSAYSFNASWEPAQVNGSYVSFIERYDYYTGGANDIQELETFNFDVSTGRELTLQDLFPGKPDYLAQISALAVQELEPALTQASEGHLMTDMLDAGTAPTENNFANFTFTGDLITIYFPKYAVAPGAFGEQHVTINVNDVK